MLGMSLFSRKHKPINPERPWDSINYGEMPEVKNMRIVKVNVSDLRDIMFHDQLGTVKSAIARAVFVTSKGRLYGAGEFLLKDEHLLKLQGLLQEIAAEIEKEL